MVKSKKKLDFEECFQRYINGSDELEVEQLNECLRVAEGFNQFAQVFHAGCNSEQYMDCGKIRSQALKTLIALASNKTEAKKALAWASRKKINRSLYYPVRFEEAKAKLATFS